MKKMTKDKVMLINSLKGIAILGVVLVHYGCNSSYSIINSIVANGARGVQLFFVINGYLIFNSLDKFDLTLNNIINWWKNKFLRIIPLYWFFTIVHLLIFGTGPRYYLGPYSHVSVLNIICNLLFLHNFYPYFNCINVNWFMGVIGIFYILAPIMKKKIDSLERIGCIFFIYPCGYLLMHILLNNYQGNYPNIWADYVNIMSFFSELPCICIGIAIFYIEKSGLLLTIKEKKWFSFALLIVAIWGAVSLGANKHFFVIGNNISSFGLIFGLIFASQLIYSICLISNPLFDYIGKHSYGIYLSHIIVLELVRKLCLNKYWIMGYIMVVLGSLFVSIILEKVIEQNSIIDYLKKKKICIKRVE